jgi:hypothetical protein
MPGTTWRYLAVLWARRLHAVLTQTFQVKLDSTLDSPKDDVDGSARCDPARKIENRGAPIAVGVLVDQYEVLKLSHDGVDPRCSSLPPVPLPSRSRSRFDDRSEGTVDRLSVRI